MTGCCCCQKSASSMMKLVPVVVWKPPIRCRGWLPLFNTASWEGSTARGRCFHSHHRQTEGGRERRACACVRVWGRRVALCFVQHGGSFSGSHLLFLSGVKSTKQSRRKLFIQTGETRKCVRERRGAHGQTEGFALDVSNQRKRL